MRHHLPALLTALAIGLAPVAGAAATMRFDGLPDETQTEMPGYAYDEDGIRLVGEGGWLERFGDTGVHLADSGTPNARKIRFSMDTRFRPVGFLVQPMENVAYRDWRGPYGVPFENLLIEGWRGSERVFSDIVYSGEKGQDWTYAFPDLPPMDAMTLTALYPDGIIVQCDEAPCAYFSVDDVELAPIPLPPAAALLLAGLGLLAAMRRRPARA